MFRLCKTGCLVVYRDQEFDQSEILLGDNSAAVVSSARYVIRVDWDHSRAARQVEALHAF